jgi:two-component system cell cycle response regulator DivK
MPTSLPLEQLARIRDNLRHLVGRAGNHELDLVAATRSADAELEEAVATQRRLLSPGAERSLAELQRVFAADVRRATARSQSTRMACVTAHEQHVAAQRLLSELDDDSPAAAPEADGSAAVLVVDDADDVREMVSLLLSDAGFVVRTATNGLEGLIAAFEMQPAVILMDMMMPVLSGLEATRLIKAMKATRDARVIAYTANPTLSELLVEKFFAAVLPKPSTPQMVIEAVKGAI